MNDRDPSSPDLRPILARLREIERKCAAMGSRNEEFPLTQQRVASIIARLEAGQEPSGEALRFARIARELFPVAHVFESVGFMSVGREIAHIERALRELEPEGPAADDDPGPTAARVSSAAARPATVEVNGVGAAEAPRSASSVPAPVIIGMLVLAAAAVVAASIVLGIGPAARLAGRAATASPSPTVALTPTATPSPSPAPAHEPAAPPASAADAGPRARLADAVSGARLALARGEIDEALAQLAAAALVDRTDEDVVEIAATLVDHFVASADEAAGRAAWDEAAERLERAGRLAMRFGLDEARVKEAERRIGDMERYRLVDPRDAGALRAALGLRAEVTLRDGSVHRGRIESVGGGTLVLDVVRELGGGGLNYAEELTLAEVLTVKVYER